MFWLASLFWGGKNPLVLGLVSLVHTAEKIRCMSATSGHFSWLEYLLIRRIKEQSQVQDPQVLSPFLLEPGPRASQGRQKSHKQPGSLSKHEIASLDVENCFINHKYKTSEKVSAECKTSSRVEEESDRLLSALRDRIDRLIGRDKVGSKERSKSWRWLASTGV